ncbi:MAG: hypothetical protein ACOY90_18625 [Candidatus Zhuqueibacterota bacterium]
MAKVKVNPIIEKIRGKVGDLVFKRYGDEVVLSRVPDMEGREATEAQQATRERFRQAALYGKMVMADPEAKALYDDAATAKGKPVFSLTIADFFNAPSVDEVDISGYGGNAGDVIRIRAHDDFDVTEVSVAIMTSAGQAVENGMAEEKPVNSGLWIYTATQAVAPGSTVRVLVTAKDRPGGTGAAEKEKPL